MANQSLFTAIFTFVATSGGYNVNEYPLLTKISGDTVRLECNRSVEGTVDWKVEYDPKDITRYVCLRGRLLDKYKPRFELDSSNYTLTIHDVMVNDSGLYYCVDDEGFGQPHFSRLVVESVKEFLSSHKDELIDMIESRFELLSHLVAKRVINNREMEEIRTKKSVFKRNELLMERICKKSEDACRTFVEALENTAQKHVANYIHGDVSTDQRPLEAEELSRIRDDNLVFLEKMLDVKHGLLDLLVDFSVITQSQMYHIMECSQSETNREFLSIMSLRSFKDVKTLMACLRITGQTHVAAVMKDGNCVAAEIRVRPSSSSKDPGSLVESELIRQVREILQKASADETRTIEHLVCLKKQDIELQAVGTGSIILYFLCRSEAAASTLHQWIVDGRLKTIIDEWFSSIMGSEVQTDVKLNEPGHLLKKCKELVGLCDRVVYRTRKFAGMPKEVTELILMKAITIRKRHKGEIFLRRRQPLIMRMIDIITVCYDWYSIVASRSYNIRRLRQWIHIRLKEPTVGDIMENRMQSEVLKIIEIDYEFLDQLVKMKVISASQKQVIQRKDSREGRISELIKYICDMDNKQCEKFMDALRATNQQHVVNALTLLDYDVRTLETGDVRPLSSDEMSSLDAKHCFLVDLLDPSNELIQLLHATGCITAQQKQSIEADRTTGEKNTRLLNILTRQSVKGYKQFVDCLWRSNQHQVATALADWGVILSYDITVSNSSLVRDIVNQFRSKYHTKGMQMSSRGAEQQHDSDVILVDIIERSHIKGYFLCKSAKGFHHLDELFLTGQLRTHLQQVFAGLVHTDIVITQLWCEPGNFIQLQLHFYAEGVHMPWFHFDKMTILERTIEPFYGLQDELASAGLMLPQQLFIRSKTTVEETNKKLISLTGARCQQLFVCLRKANQQHVVNFICKPSDNVFGNIWPMTSEQYNFMSVNCRMLTEIIELNNNDLLKKMHLSSCLTLQQKRDIESRTSASEQNELLLDILTRRSIKDFQEFREYLQIFEEGVFVPVDARFDNKHFDVDLSQICRKIVKEFETHKTADSSSVLDVLRKQLGADVSLVKLKEHRGIRAYFYCKNVMGLHRLDELCITKQLNDTLQELFDDLVPNNGISYVTDLEWKATDYARCIRYFHMKMGLLKDIYALIPHREQELSGRFNVHCWSHLCHAHVDTYRPATKAGQNEEFMSHIIVKAAGQLLRVFNKLTSGRSEIITWIVLGAVCRSWWNIVRTRPMKALLNQCFDYVCRPFRRSPLLITQMSTEDDSHGGIRGRNALVNGVAQLDDKIFAVCRDSDAIKVFGPTYERFQDIKVKGMKHPVDIVAWSENRSLYIADSKEPSSRSRDSLGSVWRVTGDGQVSAFLPRTKIVSPFKSMSLSMTSRRLLVTAWQSTLLLYDGEDAARRTSLSVSGMNIDHAVETSRGSFVVCQRGLHPRVAEIDANGLVIRSYNDQQHQFENPCYMLFDCDGKLFVADALKHHIVLLTSDLQLDRFLLDREHNQLVQKPWRLFYAQQTRQLIVGTDNPWMSHRAQVFSVGSGARK